MTDSMMTVPEDNRAMVSNHLFDSNSFDAHERVISVFDEKSGLKAIIALHSTRLGPAAGGTRMYPYATAEDAFRDVLRLSRGMSYKNAMAGLPLGGGKAVIIGDPKTDKSEAALRAFGRAVNELAGRYYTAEDMNISVHDIETIAQETAYVAGRENSPAPSGDPSPVTARGIYLGIKTCLQQKFGSDDLAGRKIAVLGIGKVGGALARHLAAEGAELIIADTNLDVLAQMKHETGARVSTIGGIFDEECDVFSPNAVGGILDDMTVERIKAPIIAGGANNQLSVTAIGQRIHDRGILYAPDYVINGGGIINVYAEIRVLQGKAESYDKDWVEKKLQKMNANLAHVLARAEDEGRPTHDVADEEARAIIAGTSALVV
ncbi:Glu/Leu/Phe/Val family dehydrogenase [Aquisalinus luteolus]|nr:Glu/Leu/Phe/Val dehydrogenase dimerization domain-containing protein [Aquisalinus luteolus]